VSDTRIRDILFIRTRPYASPGFQDVKPVVFSSLYPISSEDYPSLSDSLEKYKLNDAAFVYQKDSSAALGQGFRCGFLGLLHLEIVQERLEREYDQAFIMTVPSVQYQFTLVEGNTISVDNPVLSGSIAIASSAEPYIRASIIAPERYLGAIMKLCMERRSQLRFNYPAPAA
jgi:GTP-binding protein LepA